MARKPVTFAARLAELLSESGLTIYALAQKAELPRQTVYRYFEGDDVPSAAKLLQLARALGVSLASFDNCSVDGKKVGHV